MEEIIKKEIKKINKRSELYATAIVNGYIPDQETFSKEEATTLVRTTLAWAASIIETSIADAKHNDPKSLALQCEFKSIEAAIEDVQNGIEDQMIETSDFIAKWI